MRLYKHACLAIVGWAVIAGASAQSPETKLQESTVKPVTKSTKLIFLDSKLFDGQLSKELNGQNDLVDVEIVGRVSLTNLPGRIDKWISLVGETGEVNIKAAEPELKPKFIFDLAKMAYAGVQSANEQRTFEPAKNYNVLILYAMDGTGESKIQRIIFTRKK